MHRLVALLLPALLIACATPAPPPGRAQSERDARVAACRAEATRIVQYRERGQVMRTDETESSLGTLTVTPFDRAEADRGRAQMDRDAIMRECMGAAPEGSRR